MAGRLYEHTQVSMCMGGAVAFGLVGGEAIGG
jgi:hypothetical protein